MKARYLTSSLVAISLAVAPTVPAFARGGDAIVGGIIGGIIGGAIVKESQKKKVVRNTGTGISGTRAANMEVQQSLNYFGFSAGTPDGVLGRNSRNAIASFQQAMGYPATGELTEFERDFLVSSWKRAELGGANTLAMISQNPNGAVGVLIAWRDELVGGSGGAGGGMSVAPPMGGQLAGAPAPAPVPGVAPPGQGTGVVEAQLPSVGGGNVAPGQTGVAPGAGAGTPGGMTLAGAGVAAGQSALPSFGAAPAQQASLTSFCNQVAMVTGTNGGYATLASVSDPSQALGEQFCLARSYAIATGEGLVAGLSGVTPAQLSQQCSAFGPVMARPVSMLGTEAPQTVIAAAREVANGTGMGPQQLAQTGRICLSSGYRTDDMEVVLGSAVLLVALGEVPYSELLGHHLTAGIGAAANPTLAHAWFQLAIDAIDAGQPAVFAPGQPERVDLLRVVALGQEAPAAAVPVDAAPAPTGAVPAPAGANPALKQSVPGFSMNK